MTLDEKDSRVVDMKKLGEHGIEGAWKNAWHDHLSSSIRGIENDNQKLWRMSRLSFLAGYLHAHQEETKSDIGRVRQA